MKYGRPLVMAFLLMAMMMTTALAQDKDKNKGGGRKANAAVLQMEQGWVDALVKADTAALETIYADTLVYTHSSGAVDSKASYLASLKSGATKYHSLDREEIKVDSYGRAAVVTCKTKIKLTSNGENREFWVRMIHVYVRDNETWKMVAHQTTRLP
ncbi:MAG: nuclear transport factor 2 family protein [Blastocatellia bacterium]